METKLQRFQLCRYADDEMWPDDNGEWVHIDDVKAFAIELIEAAKDAHVKYVEARTQDGAGSISAHGQRMYAEALNVVADRARALLGETAAVRTSARDLLVHIGAWTSTGATFASAHSAILTVEDGEQLLSAPIGTAMPIVMDPATGLLWVATQGDQRPVVGWHVRERSAT